MKNILLLSFIFTLSFMGNSVAQDKFIEVMVKDTIKLRPISYEFEVSSGLQFKYDYENPNSENEFADKLKKSEEKIVAILEKYGYDFRLSQNPEASLTMDATDKRNYIVKIKDSVQKEEFKQRMKEENINFYMSDMTFEDRESKIEEIYTRLLQKARERAELIARLSNKKVGDIMEISESKSEFSTISSFIENFAYSRSYGGSVTSFKFNAGVLEKSLLVKYSAK